MLSQMVHLNRACRAVHLLLQAQKGLSQVSKTAPTVGNKLRSYAQVDKASVKELVEVYHQLAEKRPQSSMFSLTEEKLLNTFTVDMTEGDDDDDIVSRFLPQKNYAYDVLCQLFIDIASVGRRPTPLIKVASKALLKTSLPSRHENRPQISLLIATLNALIKLNYTSRPLVSKIIFDITAIINLKEIDIPTQCGILRSLGGLKWRHEPLMDLFYEHVKKHHRDDLRVNHNLIQTLLYVTANLNYQPKENFAQFYDNYMAELTSDIDMRTRRWLKLVWSLTVLDICNESYLKSVLDDEFITAIENPLDLQRFYYGDVMKLLNIWGIAKLDKRMFGAQAALLDELSTKRIQRASDMEKFALKIKNALIGLAGSEQNLRHDIQTPYGFVVDCEIRLDENMEFIPLDERTTLEDELNLAQTMSRSDTKQKKCALIYVLFDEEIVNHTEEPVGHKKIISRILRNTGYKTIFLHESLLNRQKTSSDFAKKIKEIIMTSSDVQD